MGARRAFAGIAAATAIGLLAMPATFQCALKGAKPELREFTDCGETKAKYKRLKPGKKKFRVRAIDAAGNVDPTPAKAKWKVLK